MTVAIEGMREIIRQSFVSVFQGLNHNAETAFQLYRMKAASKDRYADYITRSVGVFPLFGTNKQALVDAAYVRVAISSDLEREKYRSRTEIAETLNRQRSGHDVDDSRRHLAKTLHEVVDSSSTGIALLGNPGSGKTTAMRHFALTLAKGMRVRGRRVIPIFLAVRELAFDNQSIEQAATNLLATMEIGEPKAVFWSLVKSEDVAILLDGIDEADQHLQAKLLSEVVHIRDEYPRAIVCISGRPYSLNVGLRGFAKWETLPLTIGERLEFVKKWYDSVDSIKGEKLLAECAADSSLLDLGSSPLLLSIVCALYYNDLKIPSEPDELYARTVEGLLGAWDAFRSIARQTPFRDYSVRRRVVLVSWIAATMFSSSRIVFSVRDVELSRVLERFAEGMHATAPPAEEVLSSLYNDFGILIERAPGLYSFSHLTLQEYLTAQYIVDNRRELELLSHSGIDQWTEVIRLVAKLLPNANIFMAKLTEDVDVNNYENVMLLEAVWSVRPLCDRHQAITSMRLLAERAMRSLDNFRGSYTRDGDAIYVTLTKGRLNANRQIFKNLPSLASIIRASGVSLHDLRMTDTAPFAELLANDEFRTVVINRDSGAA